MSSAIKVLPRMEKGPNGWREVLFLPNTKANRGFIAYCSPYEGHGEACYDYYLKTKPMSKDKCPEAWLNWYANYGGECAPVRLAKRITFADSVQAYL